MSKQHGDGAAVSTGASRRWRYCLCLRGSRRWRRSSPPAPARQPRAAPQAQVSEMKTAGESHITPEQAKQLSRWWTS